MQTTISSPAGESETIDAMPKTERPPSSGSGTNPRKRKGKPPKKAPNLSPVAAIAMRETIDDMIDERPGGAKAQWKRVLSDENEYDQFLEMCAARLGSKTRHLMGAIHTAKFHFRKVDKSRSLTTDRPNEKVLTKAAVAMAKAINTHAGTRREIAMAPERVPETRTPGEWTATEGGKPGRPRKERSAPWESMRILLGTDRLDLSDHAVVAPARARARYETWRVRSNAPVGAVAPEHVARAVIYEEKPPTAVAAHSDHLVFAKSGRYVTPAQYANLFEIPRSAMREALETGSGLHEARVVTAMCAGVYVPDGRHAMQMAIAQYGRELRPEGGPVRYAEAFAGVGVQATANDGIFGEWVFVSASESDAAFRSFLATSYAARGLSEERIAWDARDNTRECPETDAMFMGMPCGPWSSRNRRRSETSAYDAERTVRQSLWYARQARPKVLVVENVRSREGESIIGAALRTLPGYTMSVRYAKADSMTRKRVFWIMSRDD